ncbi:MAG TPA: nucleotidyl transferase AbiEii/AbiGii toxin family protein [Candidatus Nanoarchaeia archaeon]|nr:nucleotidyl transferase AbiEii/AbiGii toxin family protein [Candidatus Nanoarchaeia archaeon]
MFYNILDKQRLAILPLLKNFKADFYLAGGTGLALQFGHRDSIDFDFFTAKNFATGKLYGQIKKIFAKHKILKVQEEKNTLTVFIDNKIKISFFSYPYKLIGKSLNEENFKIASIEDIAIMKLAAIVSRATNKDYIDLYFILKKISLKNVLKKMEKKLPDLDINLVLKSLVYFSDIVYEPIKFKNNNSVDFSEVKKNFITEVEKI